MNVLVSDLVIVLVSYLEWLVTGVVVLGLLPDNFVPAEGMNITARM